MLISSITPDSLKAWGANTIAVVAHDAGATRHLQGWISSLGPQLRFCVSGPANALLKTERGDFANLNLKTCLEDCQLLISGTGWSSSLEHDSRLMAKELDIPSIAVLDHWVNYLPRFERNGERVLPECLWVADSEAAKLAEQELAGIPITQLSNKWLEEVQKNVQIEREKIGKKKPTMPAKNLLYLLEPLRDRESGMPNLKEFIALEYWLKEIPKLIDLGIAAKQNELKLYLRMHPSETKEKYISWINNHNVHWPLMLDDCISLEQSLAKADMAFGCETQALVAAMACDLPSISTIPPTEPQCRLPHKNLKHLSLISKSFETKKSSTRVS